MVPQFSLKKQKQIVHHMEQIIENLMAGACVVYVSGTTNSSVLCGLGGGVGFCVVGFFLSPLGKVGIVDLRSLDRKLFLSCFGLTVKEP